MMDEERRYSAIIFLGALLMTLVSALVIRAAILVFLFLAVQICAYVWYVASYIPMGRTCIKNCLGAVLRRGQ
jgi:hypothetical protein